ncbi:hypothetical protein WH221_05860 [Chryseobacterium culicis]|uniref:Uncharacterized protein n=1 Tax=Chryseobacterium culicis TaxID=680127 RepID=A0A2S9CZ30_CHRCI|nr:hypothetical protein [Chryseobacterium culicis]PRB85772.1 hypothetical protein CQ022_05820 [Chryseobacterium culicis]PRB90504.1 hypothetical protein CQ033_07165 [Chryseobacterium culicis]
MRALPFLFFFTFQLFSAQFVHVAIHLNNTDSDTRQKLLEIAGHTAARAIQLKLQNDYLEEMIKNDEEFLERNYKKSSKFDKQNSFIKNSIKTGALGVGPVILNRFKKLPYITNVKNDYLQSLALDKLVLLALQNVDASKIKASERQEIYRIRDLLVRVYSKNDKEVFGVMTLPALALLIQSNPDLIQLIKNLEIVF